MNPSWLRRIADRLMDFVSRVVALVVFCVRIEVVLPPGRFGESPRHRLLLLPPAQAEKRSGLDLHFEA